jgi:hypothetical protein
MQSNEKVKKDLEPKLILLAKMIKAILRKTIQTITYLSLNFI